MTHRPEPVIRGRRTFLRAGERADVPALVPWFNDHADSRDEWASRRAADPLPGSWPPAEGA